MVDYDNYQQLMFIFQNIQLVIAIIGIIGGILNICVFSRNAVKSFSFSFYMKAMSCCDIIILIHYIRFWIAFKFDVDLDTVSIFFCKFDMYQVYVASCMVFWLINVISLDRLAVVVYSNNQKFQVFKKKWFKVTILLIILVGSLSLCILQPLKNKLVLLPDSTIQLCFMPADSGVILSYISLGNTIFSIIVNFVLNTKIIIYAMQTRKKISANMRSSSTAVKDRRFVINVVVLNSSCLICKTMFMICMVVNNYVSMSVDLDQLIVTISFTIAAIDNANTFFINLIVNPTFYAEFLCMIRLRIQQGLP